MLLVVYRSHQKTKKIAAPHFLWKSSIFFSCGGVGRSLQDWPIFFIFFKISFFWNPIEKNNQWLVILCPLESACLLVAGSLADATKLQWPLTVTACLRPVPSPATVAFHVASAAAPPGPVLATKSAAPAVVSAAAPLAVVTAHNRAIFNKLTVT